MIDLPGINWPILMDALVVEGKPQGIEIISSEEIKEERQRPFVEPFKHASHSLAAIPIQSFQKEWLAICSQLALDALEVDEARHHITTSRGRIGAWHPQAS